MVFSGGSKYVYLPHSSTHTMGARVSGITTETTAPPLLSYAG
jgi:hypothetical protein